MSAEIEIDQYFDTIEYDYPKFHLSMHCYLCHVKSGHLRLLEHEDAKWLDREHLEEVEWLPADRTIIDKLKQL